MDEETRRRLVERLMAGAEGFRWTYETEYVLRRAAQRVQVRPPSPPTPPEPADS